VLRYLAILLLAPLWLILCWGYWAYPKSLPATSGRRIFDFVMLLLALIAAVQGALLGFDRAMLPEANEFGRVSGAIWQQVQPALYGYGAFTAVLVLAMVLRYGIWGRHR
jgi:hypothetical protein